MNELGWSTGRTERVSSGRSGLIVDVGDDERRAVLVESARDGLANAGATPGDYTDSSINLHCSSM